MPAAGAINLFYFYANKLIDISQKILYTWTVAGDGGYTLEILRVGPPQKSLGPSLRAWTHIPNRLEFFELISHYATRGRYAYRNSTIQDPNDAYPVL